MTIDRLQENESVGDRWIAATADGTGEVFSRLVTSDLRMEGSIFLKPLIGVDAAWAALRTTARIYDEFSFTASATNGGRTYLEWTAIALGQEMAGVTVLTSDEAGRLQFVALHHRPLAAVLSFSIEMRRLLLPPLDPTFFYRGFGPDR
jgi:hypothetical protein